jgi:tetratricopeptide (TPR) repeat protein
MSCPPDDVLQRFVENTAPEDERRAFGEHLAACADCLARVTVLHTRKDDSLAAVTQDVGQPTGGVPKAERPALPRGTVVGRYVVLDVLGRGGMGEVYAAFDPELDRKVAVKLVKSDASYGEQQNETRLFREAQAMARLAHPNVVPVYDVGIVDNRVFLAMELVTGTTVKRWTKDAQRSWREVLRVYLEAAQGLSAAHKSGLLHRDFKPDNVLIGDDGRVRVVDFGLAKTNRSEPPAEKSVQVELHGHNLLETDLTLAASVLGTPAYMAPERLGHGGEDARIDQFSFCVSLYEGLYGEKPFGGDTTQKQVNAIMQGAVREAPSGRGVPAWLRRIVVKGLSLKPSDRYPSMDALIADLGADVEGRRRNVALGVTAVALVFAFVLGSWRVISARTALCRGSEAQLGGAWDDRAREATLATFEKVSGPLGKETYKRASHLLDDWARGWVETRTQVCEATRLRGEQPEPVLTVRMACLDRALGNLRAAARLLETADSATVVKAVDVAAGLPRLDECAHTEQLLNAIPPPTDPQVLQRVADARAAVAAAQAAWFAGKYEHAKALVEPALAAARDTHYTPVMAEAAFVLGRAIERLGDAKASVDAYHEAARLAYEARDDELMARASARLAYSLGYLLTQQEEAQRWLAVANAALERAGHPPLPEADVLDLQGIVEVAAGRIPEATKLIEKAVALRTRELGEDNLETSRAMNHLSLMYSFAGDQERALAMQETILKIQRTVLGDLHPDLAETLIAIGGTHYRAKHYDLALAAYQESQRVLEGALGPDHPDLVVALNNVGAAFNSLKRYPEALEIQRRALALKEKQLGPDHPDVGTILANIGQTEGELGNTADSIAHLQRAVAVVEKASGPIHPNTATLLGQLADEYVRAKRLADALPLFERILRIATQAQLEPVWFGHAQLSYVEVLFSTGEKARAREVFKGCREALTKAGLEKDVAVMARELGVP